jgi:hypothetical protein
VYNKIKNHLYDGSSGKARFSFIHFEALFAFLLITGLLFYFKFPILSLVIILPLTVISAYNIGFIGCQIGLVQIGRFTTFVMIPTLLLFKLTSLQITILCVLVSVCISTSADLLFDYKIGSLCEVSDAKIHRYQWLGVVVTSACMGLVLWLLFTNLQLGTAELFAQRAKSRALLIQSFDFNWMVVFLGFLYGLILKKMKISPSMVFGGLLMPNGLTIGLVIGAVGSLFLKKKKDLFPFFSGIFAGESIWLILSILTKVL